MNIVGIGSVVSNLPHIGIVAFAESAWTTAKLMLEWNLYWPMLKAALEHWSGVIPAVYLEIIPTWIDDTTLEQLLNPFVGC